MKKLPPLLCLALLALTGCCATHKIYIGDGLIVKSPNGTKYQVIIDDNGQTDIERIK